MDKADWIFSLFTTSSCTLIIGLLIGHGCAYDSWHDDMIAAGCAHHNAKTGDWEWTGEPCNPGAAMKEAE